MRKLGTLLFVTAMLVFFVHWHLAAQENRAYKIIVNAENPATSLSKDEVSRLLLKKITQWDNGTPADPVDLDSKSQVRDVFSQDIHGRSVASVKNYWQRQIFSGRAIPPPELSQEQDVIQFVQSRAGAIGYISARRSADGVKVISLTE